MGLLDVGTEDPKSRGRRYILMAGISVALIIGLTVWLWFGVLHMPERSAAGHFFDALTSGNTQGAYQLAKADSAHYAYQDFLDDWGPTGFYGPVKSYHIESASAPPKEGSGIIVTVDVSPYEPFPGNDDVEKSSHTKEVHLWVETRDKSISISPF
jgi:hypothetical protein